MIRRHRNITACHFSLSNVKGVNCTVQELAEEGTEKRSSDKHARLWRKIITRYASVVTHEEEEDGREAKEEGWEEEGGEQVE